MIPRATGEPRSKTLPAESKRRLGALTRSVASAGARAGAAGGTGRGTTTRCLEPPLDTPVLNEGGGGAKGGAGGCAGELCSMRPAVRFTLRTTDEITAIRMKTAQIRPPKS